jgi:hypothetical protein
MDFIGKLYALSGFANIFGLLTFNKFFTGASVLANAAPGALSVESQMLIPVWGMAYIAAANHWKKLPLLSCVFFVEKMLFVGWWVALMQDIAKRDAAIAMVTSGSDVLSGSFLLMFGANDLLFGLVFGYGAWKGFVSLAAVDKKK